jgi:tetratricopeptide (TPR) repeat protein
MENEHLSNTLFKFLQSAITRKLRSLTQTDAVRLWEQSVRQYSLQCLIEAAAADTEMALTLQAIPTVEKPLGVKLVDLLDRLSVQLGRLDPVRCRYPLWLMRAIMVKPMNVQAALAFMSVCEDETLSETHAYCAVVIRAELLSDSGEMHQAYAALKPLLQSATQPLLLRVACCQRFFRLARTRDTAEAMSTLLMIRHLLKTSDEEGMDFHQAVSECTRELASLHVMRGESDKARAYCQESLKSLQHLITDQPDREEFQLLQALTLRTQGVIEHESGQMQVSQAVFRQAADRVEKLVSRDPQESLHTSELPRSHDVLGDIHVANLELDRALAEYSASAAVGAHLSFRDPLNMRWKVEEITSAIRIALVLKKMGRLQEGVDMLQAILRKANDLILQDEGNMEHHATLAQLKMELGDLYWLQQRHAQAGEHYQQALQSTEHVLQLDHGDTRWLTHHLLTLQRLAEVEYNRGQLDSALNLLIKARDGVLQGLRQGVHKKKLRQLFVVINTRLADYAFESGRTQVGMDVQNMALEMAGQFQQDHADWMAWKPILACIQIHVARQNLKLGLMTESQAQWQTAIASLQRLAVEHPEDHELEVNAVQARLVQVDWLSQNAEHPQAFEVCSDLMAQVRVRRTTENESEQSQDLWCGVLERFADCCQNLQKDAEEKQARSELVQMRKQFLQTQPESVVYQCKYFTSLVGMGRYCLRVKQPEQAIVYLNDALKGYDELHQAQVQHGAYLLSIGDILLYLGHARFALKDSYGAQITLNKALVIAGWLGRLGQENYAMVLAALNILLMVAKSPAYRHDRKALLTLASDHAAQLQSISDSPKVRAIVEEIARRQAQA